MSKILGLTWLPKLGPIRVLSWIYRLRKKPRVAEGHELGGSGDMPPEFFLKCIYAEMQSGAF